MSWRRLVGQGSLRTRVTVVGMVTLALVLGLGAWVTVRALGAGLRSDIESQNEEVLDSLATAIADGANVETLRLPLGADGTEFVILDQQERLINASVLPFAPTPDELAAILAADPGAVVFESGVVSGPIVVDDFTDPTSGFIIESFELPADQQFFVDADNWFETRRSVLTPDDQAVTLVALSPLGVISRSVDRLAVAMSLIVPLLVLAGGFALWWAVGAALAPVRRISDEANRIAPSNSGARLPVPGSDDEIAELTVTLNGMLDRLDAGLIRQRQFVSDASHELRSPLTAVRGAAGLLTERHDLPPEVGPSLTALERGAERLEAVLDDLTGLASAGVAVDRQEIDLADLIVDEIESVRSQASAVTIDTDRVEPTVILANPLQLARAVNNVVANALRHARTRVEVATRTGVDGVEIVIDDDGPGVPAADRDRIFERFVRLDDARSRDRGGSGLGLALVASILAGHGGTATCVDSPLGGARFVLVLPFES